MEENKEQEILEKVMSISELIEQGIDSNERSVESINYYKDFTFQESNLAENDIFVAKIENTKDNTNTYEIYSGATNNLIATVDEQGKLQFMPEYIERLKQINPRIVEMLNLENARFELPQELNEYDRIFTKEEREQIMQKKENKALESNKEQEKQPENKEEEQPEKTPEELEQEQIAESKGIPTHSVLFVKENSNLYKDHPNLEKNLYFYRDNDGTVKAEYLDSNGNAQPSQYFEASTTFLRQETVSLGNDGNPVTKEVPYQVMRTKGLNNVDKDIRDIRININIDTYGYLEIEEARQGKNGEWLSHEIEVKGRNYNSHAVNASTSIRTRNADPDKQTEAYDKVENTSLSEDGVQYSEMYLIEYADEVVNALIKEGYQKDEAVRIVDYVIGEEKLSFIEAKERVDDEIGKAKETRGNTQYENDMDEERTPWRDAERRDARKEI